MVEKALEVRGCKVKITKVPIPVPYGPAFEGERIRKTDVQAEFGGNITPAFEFVTSAEMDQINDGEIELIGPDIDEIPVGSALPLAIWVEVAGRKMQPDFEPILERQIHHLINGAEGIWHMGQRDIVWARISKDGFDRGLRLKDFGRIIHAKFLSEYPAIVDKVKVTFFTEADEVEKRLVIARKIYGERNLRLAAMTDESVDTFYSCLLCQSFAPNHVCIITPERLGLCGAYNWLDGKAAHQIDETGPNQPVKKGETLDPVKGIWKGVNDYVFQNSHKTVSAFSAYSIMDRPMTSCGCFEAICAYLPECNGIMVVNREFLGDTPVGMTFSSLAGNVGGGQQTPGFIGIGKAFLTSKKFLAADGGFKRLVWMTTDLKQQLGPALNAIFEELGIPNFMDQIADETVAIEANEVRNYLESNGHPALGLEDLANFAEVETDAEALPAADSVHPPPENEAAPVDAPEEISVQGVEDNLAGIGPDVIAQIKNQVAREVMQELKTSLTQEIVGELKSLLTNQNSSVLIDAVPATELPATNSVEKTPEQSMDEMPINTPSIKEKLAAVKLFPIPMDKCETPVWTVKLGANNKEGGTRETTYKVGGETCMPFHLWEGDMPHPPLVALEVFDTISEKYPPILRQIYGDLLEEPAKMAEVCVNKYGADLISVRLEGTHPEKGGLTAEQAVETVKSVLKAVSVPLIITGHNSFEKNNEVLKAVAQACAGENLLLSWAENDNYQVLAGAAMAYNHTLVAQSPIDVNIAKQLNILLTNMGIKQQNIMIDPLTGATGYGLEYTYSVMERIRITGLGGDKMLAGPMIVSPGQECAKIKEFKADEADFPTWGDLGKRSAMWELSTAMNLLYAGADVLIMYHPEAAMSLKRSINELMDS